MTISTSGTFRGIDVNRLTRLVEYACAGGGIVLMKSVNLKQNIGKVPHLVLAEQLIMALKDEEQGAQYDE